MLLLLLSSAIPQLSGTRALTCSVSDLETPYRCRTECRLPISIVHCSSELLSSNDPPASASMTLGLQAHATTPGRKLYHKSAL
uniref:Secreted protein n=1 Tax=Oryzias melastigma TaxID=30732 RepID=A0A3B3CCK0_ORYME